MGKKQHRAKIQVCNERQSQRYSIIFIHEGKAQNVGFGNLPSIKIKPTVEGTENGTQFHFFAPCNTIIRG